MRCFGVLDWDADGVVCGGFYGAGAYIRGSVGIVAFRIHRKACLLLKTNLVIYMHINSID